MSLDWLRHCPAGQLWRAEARIGLYTASVFLGGDAGSRGAGNGVAGAIGTLQGLLWYDLPQRVLLLYLEDVWLLSLVLADPKWEKGGVVLQLVPIPSLYKSLLFADEGIMSIAFASPKPMLCYH